MVGTKKDIDAEAMGYAGLAEELKKIISAGEIPPGKTLPPTKELAARYGVSPETARRAAKQLEREGLVTAQARQGFRVLARANDPDRGRPIAFVMSNPEKTELWDDFDRLLFAHLQKAAADRGWSILAVGVGRRAAREVMDQLRDSRACGMVLDSINPDLLAEVTRVQLPTIMMDSWDPAMSLDAVVQNSFQGALLATRHLIARGHTNIGWLGRISQSVHSEERFGGFATALATAGLKARPEFMLDTPADKTASAARELLARRDRPTGVLGLWHDAAIELTRAASELGLEPGKDVEIVGWTPEEQYETAYRAGFAGQTLPPTVVWSIAELARVTLARLAERRAHPAPAPVLIRIPTRLRLPETEHKEKTR